LRHANYLCNHKCRSIKIDTKILWRCISFFVVSGRGLIAKRNAPVKCFTRPSLLFAYHAKPDCGQSTITSRIQLLWIMETLTQLWNCNFPEAFFCRHLRMGRESFENLLMLRSITKYDDQLKGICQGTIDFLARQKIVSLQS